MTNGINGVVAPTDFGAVVAPTDVAALQLRNLEQQEEAARNQRTAQRSQRRAQAEQRLGAMKDAADAKSRAALVGVAGRVVSAGRTMGSAIGAQDRYQAQHAGMAREQSLQSAERTAQQLSPEGHERIQHMVDIARGVSDIQTPREIAAVDAREAWIGAGAELVGASLDTVAEFQNREAAAAERRAQAHADQAADIDDTVAALDQQADRAQRLQDRALSHIEAFERARNEAMSVALRG